MGEANDDDIEATEAASPSPSVFSSSAATTTAILVDVQMLLCHVPRAGVDHCDVLAAAERAGLKVLEIDPAQWRKGACVENSPPEDYERAKLYLLQLTWSAQQEN